MSDQFLIKTQISHGSLFLFFLFVLLGIFILLFSVSLHTTGKKVLYLIKWKMFINICFARFFPTWLCWLKVYSFFQHRYESGMVSDDLYGFCWSLTHVISSQRWLCNSFYSHDSAHISIFDPLLSFGDGLTHLRNVILKVCVCVCEWNTCLYLKHLWVSVWWVYFLFDVWLHPSLIQNHIELETSF